MRAKNVDEIDTWCAGGWGFGKQEGFSFPSDDDVTMAG
jgi:hypothetical protein